MRCKVESLHSLERTTEHGLEILRAERTHVVLVTKPADAVLVGQFRREILSKVPRIERNAKYMVSAGRQRSVEITQHEGAVAPNVLKHVNVADRTNGPFDKRPRIRA